MGNSSGKNDKGSNDGCVTQENQKTGGETTSQKIRDSYICNSLGNLYKNQKRYDKAFQKYSKAIELNPQGSEAYYYRGNLCHYLKDIDKALQDYSKVIELNPKNSAGYYSRGILYDKYLKDFDKALQDYEKAVELNQSSGTSSVHGMLCSIGRLYVERDEIEKGMEFFEKAIEEDSNNPLAFINRLEALSYVEEDREREMEDYFRVFELLRSRNSQKQAMEVKLKTIHQRLKSSQKDGKRIFPHAFREDNLTCDEELEKNEIEKLKTLIFEKTLMSDLLNDQELEILRPVGGGVFCSTFLCHFVGIHFPFVIKVLKPENEAKLKKMKDRDCVPIPYHRNIVATLTQNFFQTEIELDKDKLFPDPKDRRRRFWQGKIIRTPLILMKYYRKDLEKYVDQRRAEKKPFKPLELCYMLKGLLRGVSHLHQNWIIHRDLHPGNVFVDEFYGRIFIGDFGCSLDLREKKSFNVEIKKNFSPSMYYEFSAYKGGNRAFLSPEVVDCPDPEEGGMRVVDFSKNDLFSVGMLGYYLISEEKDFFAFGYEVGMWGKEAIFEHRKQEKYVELTYDERICGLIKKLLMVDPKERIGHEESVSEIEKIQKYYKEMEKAEREAPPLEEVRPPLKKNEEETEGKE